MEFLLALLVMLALLSSVVLLGVAYWLDPWPVDRPTCVRCTECGAIVPIPTDRPQR